MQFSTPVNIPHAEGEITYQNKILLIGSCFADNLTSHLQASFFQATSNPFGVLYNPMSIAQCLQLLQKTYDTSAKDVAKSLPIVQHDGLYHCMTHHGCFSSADKEQLTNNIETSLREGAEQLAQADTLILTFGTAWVYEQEGKVVGNCHKLPASLFQRRCLHVEEIVATYQGIAQLPLLRNKQVIFTISPIRHKNDGLHGNQLSKSILLLATDRLTEKMTEPKRNSQEIPCMGHWEYFPSYEIMLDELRDYRYYADDMMHPSPKAVGYIWERFCETYFSTQTKEEMKSLQRLYSSLQHIPLHPDTDAYRKFSEQLSEQLRYWQGKYPWIKGIE